MSTVFRLLPNGARRRLPDGTVRSLGADGLRYADAQGSVGLGVASGGGATAGVYVTGVSVLTFSLSGVLTQDGFVGQTTLTFIVGGTMSARVYAQGATNLAFSTTAIASAGQIIRGATQLGFITTGTLARSTLVSGSLALSMRMQGRMHWSQLLRGTTRVGFNVSGLLTTAAGGRWRDLWLDFYAKRQIVLNAIDANNRLLARTAGDAATATAAALVITNTNVTVLDGRITAESNRTTALTTRVSTAEGTLVSQGSAINTLGTRATSIEGVNTVQGNAITSLQTEVAGKASSSALSALQSTVTTQGNTITSQGTAITAVTAQAGSTASAMTVLDAKVTVNEAGVAQAKAIYGVYLDVDGNISGTQSINDGVTSEFNVMATIFRLLSAGATGIEIRDGYIRAYNGVTQRIIGGAGFGASGDLMDYFGPNVGIASASKANATMWFDTSGAAYFGGSLSAGVLKNAARSTQASKTATVSTGEFSSLGGTRVVVGSFSLAHSGWVAGNVAGASASIVLTIRRGATVVATTTLSGGYTATYESEFNATRMVCNFGGSVTYTDNTGGTAVEYSATLSGATGSWPMTLFVNNSGAGTQSAQSWTTGIISVEEP